MLNAPDVLASIKEVKTVVKLRDFSRYGIGREIYVKARDTIIMGYIPPRSGPRLSQLSCPNVIIYSLYTPASIASSSVDKQRVLSLEAYIFSALLITRPASIYSLLSKSSFFFFFLL